MTTVFTPKSFLEILAGAVERVRTSTDKLTDFNVGSVSRSLIEAHAIELEDYYQAIFIGLTKAIPTSLYIGFGFERLGSVSASGTMLLFRDDADDLPAIEIPAGTRFQSTYGQFYASSEAATLAVGETEVEVIVVAETPGDQGNALPGEIQAYASSGAWAAANEGSFVSGADEETDEQRASRFAEFILALSRGTPAALEFAATIPQILDPTTGAIMERVQRTSVNETPGHVDLHIHNGAWGISAELQAAVQVLIDGDRDEDSGEWVGGYRPAGMRVDVVPFTVSQLSISVEVERDSGVEAVATEAAVRAALESYLSGLVPGNVVRPADWVAAVLTADGVFGVTPIAPTTSVVVPANAIMALGDLVVSWVE